ncbi:hypothetical protein Q5P01_012723 [Channa striata]|uniref:Uncharacterized protein n=1 Tax=Channa striata TaxID=64152 RepID=A0AA88MT36_CHASR|nr:hypothetical protein Q5P01_012723 [Channa striata]
MVSDLTPGSIQKLPEPARTVGYQCVSCRSWRLFALLSANGLEVQCGWGLGRMDACFRYYFQHPWSRLIVAYLVTFFNFLIFAEDPVSHSQTEAHMIVVGNCFSFLFNKYPGLGWNILKIGSHLIKR